MAAISTGIFILMVGPPRQPKRTGAKNFQTLSHPGGAGGASTEPPHPAQFLAATGRALRPGGTQETVNLLAQGTSTATA
jgi:hypothetical protein